MDRRKEIIGKTVTRKKENLCKCPRNATDV